MQKCKGCQKDTKNPSFCSRSCAASSNNKKTKLKTGRYKSTKKCLECNSEHHRWSQYCSRLCYLLACCRIRNKGHYTVSKRDSNRYVPIRELARKIALLSLPNQCHICKYKLHIECCHIKPITSFSDSTCLREINNPSNLILLCPNHHWEMDNGYLSL